MIHQTDSIISNFDNWNKTNKKDLLDRINCEVMHLVYKFRDVQHHFNMKFGSDAYINIEVEKWRRYIRSFSTKSSNDLKLCLQNYKNKLSIDFEIQQMEYTDKKSEWNKLMLKEEQLTYIFHSNWLQKNKLSLKTCTDDNQID